MAWLVRNGNRYYYRKKRIGERVTSEYIGTGPLAESFAKLDAADRDERERKRRKERAERKRFEETDKELKELAELVTVITHGALIARGCHTHKGTWRKLRNG